MKEIEKEWETTSIQRKKEYFILQRTVYRTTLIQQQKEIPKELEEKYDEYNMYYLLKENHSPKVSHFISPQTENEFIQFEEKIKQKNEKNTLQLNELNELNQFDEIQNENEINKQIERKSFQEIINDWNNQTLEERKEYFIRKRKAMRKKYKNENKEIPHGLEKQFDEFNLCYLLHFNKSPVTNKLYSPTNEDVIRYEKRESLFNQKENERKMKIKEDEQEIEIMKKQTKQYEKEKEEIKKQMERMKKEQEKMKEENEQLRKDKQKNQEEINELIKKFDDLMKRMNDKEKERNENKTNKLTTTIKMFESKGNHKRSNSQQIRNNQNIQFKKLNELKDENDSNEKEIKRSLTPKYHSRGCSISNETMINGRVVIIPGLNTLKRNSTRMIEEIKEIDEK